MAVKYIRIEDEIHTMLYGNSKLPPQSHWILLRWYRIGEYSKYWDSRQKEAIGGPKWKYQDWPIRVTNSIGPNIPSSLRASMSRAETIIPGKSETDYRVYLIERCYNPKIGDHILEYDCSYSDNVLEFVSFAKTHRAVKHRVINIEAIRTDGSRIVYYLASTILDQEIK